MSKARQARMRVEEQAERERLAREQAESRRQENAKRIYPTGTLLFRGGVSYTPEEVYNKAHSYRRKGTYWDYFLVGSDVFQFNAEEQQFNEYIEIKGIDDKMAYYSEIKAHKGENVLMQGINAFRSLYTPSLRETTYDLEIYVKPFMPGSEIIELAKKHY